ncbi:MAG TPA: YiiX/YebB-like N1pC/P60 family cysteine hydrolase [Bacteroidia bacterium]|nr:YiiX/YebB-like N1pC/P60 family cysteine hydrolase [Bacteroidia bacterium]HNS11097.1 YiiX/YebB-like N1pC/P60 family cysteine hydrolase [Bacteroidia bacterium]
MKRFPDLLLLTIAIGTIFCCSFSATGLLSNSWRNEKRNGGVVTPSTAHLRSGDIIFRDGKSYISKALKQFNRTDPRFSHAGIIHMEGNNAFVYHCIGGEENITNKMRKETLSSFCSPSEINSYAIYRPALSKSQIVLLDSIAGSYYSAGLEFDTHFNINDQGKMYCTELIYNIFDQLLGSDNFITLTEIAGKKYVSCDNIFLQPQMKELYKYSYNSKNKKINENPGL